MRLPLPSRARRLAAVSTAAVLMLAACGDDTSEPNEATTAGVAVDAVWARSSPSMARAGAVYFTVANAGDQADALLGAAVDPSVAARTELHEMVAADGGGMTPATTGTGHGGDGQAAMMTMQPVDRVEVGAGDTVTLAPGGYHVMLSDLAEPLEVGDRFEVTLSFERAGDVTVTADVRDSAP